VLPVLSGSSPIFVERFSVVHCVEAWQPQAALIVSACLRKSSMGLLQEKLLEVRLKPTIVAYLRPCQSGYLKGIEDPQLVLHEVCCQMRVQKRNLFIVMGDFVKAFPRVWRDYWLALMFKGPQIRDGAFALLASMLKFDEVYIWLSGRSSVRVVQGIPEGGSLGPMGYNLLPDTLVRFLESRGHGVGVSCVMPVAWANHTWHGSGTPVEAVVAGIRSALRTGADLPPSELLSSWPDLEASAARALDLESDDRLACTFHADDPVFLASSFGAMQCLLDDVSAWASEVGASFHVGPKKTVAMVSGACVPCVGSLTFEGHGLSLVGSHRWLGVLWPANLDFRPFMLLRLQLASVMVAQLAGFASSSMLPWAMVAELFETKVDSLLGMGRWLLCMADDAQSIIDIYYDSWGRLLIGAAPWRNAASCSSEIGWRMTGFARVVKAVALRRATLWVKIGIDWHASFFSGSSPVLGSWAHRSAELLDKWSVVDWPAWTGVPRTYDAYKQYVIQTLEAACLPAWRAVVARHRSHIPYPQFDEAPGLVVARLRLEELPTPVALHLRSWLRLRCGLLDLSHIDGRRSAARVQSCIACEGSVRNPMVHCLSLCTYWSIKRAAVLACLVDGASLSTQALALRTLSSSLCLDALVVMAAWAVDMDRFVYDFWCGRR
jgi:hypothetical protein